MISLFNRVEYSVGTGENAGYHNFLLFAYCVPKPCSLVSLKVWIELTFSVPYVREGGLVYLIDYDHTAENMQSDHGCSLITFFVKQ